MPPSIFLIFSIFGTVSRWAVKALEDGKVTLKEAAELASDVAGALGVPTELEIPGLGPPTGETSETTIEEQPPKLPPADDTG